MMFLQLTKANGEQQMSVVTERLIVRTTPELREKLERIANSQRIGRISDHIRLALEEYVERHETSRNVTEPTQTIIAQS
jgi:metal-responsive CopG/Arc/MetJ family transcriptional regulator